MSRLDDTGFPGTRYGMLTPLWPVHNGGRRLWECTCECGGFKLVQRFHLTAGVITNCGCCKQRHGLRHLPEYETWKNLRRRYSDIVKRWKRFTRFLEDMGSRPSPKHSLMRLDCFKPYGPRNCIWSSTKASARRVNDSDLAN